MIFKSHYENYMTISEGEIMMKEFIETLITKIKCLLFKHDEGFAFSFKTGKSTTYCKRCDKEL